jgi:hypothetical protein
MIQALQAYQYKSDDAFMRIHPFVSSSVYVNNEGQRVALVYNSSASNQTISFVVNGSVQNKSIEGFGFKSILLS